MNSKRSGDEREPGLFTLIGEAGHDAIGYAKAEVAYLKAQAAERASYAWPGLALLVGALVLAMGALVALLVGLIFILYRPLGGWAVPVVVFATVAIAGALGYFGAMRLKGAAKPPEAR